MSWWGSQFTRNIYSQNSKQVNISLYTDLCTYVYKYSMKLEGGIWDLDLTSSTQKKRTSSLELQVSRWVFPHSPEETAFVLDIGSQLEIFANGFCCSCSCHANIESLLHSGSQVSTQCVCRVCCWPRRPYTQKDGQTPSSQGLPLSLGCLN